MHPMQHFAASYWNRNTLLQAIGIGTLVGIYIVAPSFYWLKLYLLKKRGQKIKGIVWKMKEEQIRRGRWRTRIHYKFVHQTLANELRENHLLSGYIRTQYVTNVPVPSDIYDLILRFITQTHTKEFHGNFSIRGMLSTCQYAVGIPVNIIYDPVHPFWFKSQIKDFNASTYSDPFYLLAPLTILFSFLCVASI